MFIGNQLDFQIASIVFDWIFVDDIGGGYWKRPDGELIGKLPKFSSSDYTVDIMKVLKGKGIKSSLKTDRDYWLITIWKDDLVFRERLEKEDQVSSVFAKTSIKILDYINGKE